MARGKLAANLVWIMICVSSWGHADELWPSARASGRAERRIMATLASQTELQFNEAPLDQAADIISERHECPVAFDTWALDEANLTPTDETVTIDVRVSLRSGLTMMLNPLGLTYVVKNETLLITTPEHAREMRSYNISPLMQQGVTLEDLHEVLRDLVPAPTRTNLQTTRDNRGTSKPKAVKTRGYRVAANGKLLVARATDQEHCRIARTLKSMQMALDGTQGNSSNSSTTQNDSLFGDSSHSVRKNRKPRKRAAKGNSQEGEDDPFSFSNESGQAEKADDSDPFGDF